METFFKEIAKEKARKMLKPIETFEVFIGEHKYNLTIKLNVVSKHKSLSFNVVGLDNTYIQNCELLSF